MSELSCCGCMCDECQDFQNGCGGCHSIAGKPAWAAKVGMDGCPYYRCCVTERNLDHCGQCEELPCSVFHQCVDPSVSEEEAKIWIEERVACLKLAAETAK